MYTAVLYILPFPILWWKIFAISTLAFYLLTANNNANFFLSFLSVASEIQDLTLFKTYIILHRIMKYIDLKDQWILLKALRMCGQLITVRQVLDSV